MQRFRVQGLAWSLGAEGKLRLWADKCPLTGALHTMDTAHWTSRQTRQKYIMDSLHVLHSGIPRSFKGLSYMCIIVSYVVLDAKTGRKYAKICPKCPTFEVVKCLPEGLKFPIVHWTCRHTALKLLKSLFCLDNNKY